MRADANCAVTAARFRKKAWKLVLAERRLPWREAANSPILGSEDRFVKRRLEALLLIGLALASTPFASARADSTYDMATFSCQDWLDASDDERDLMLVWLRGYLGGRSGSSLYDPEATRMDRTNMEIYCRGHLTIGVVSAMAQLPH